MILPIPLGVEEALERLPRVTIAIIALCFVVFALTSASGISGIETQEKEIENVAEWALIKAAKGQPDLAAFMAGYPTTLALLRDEEAWTRNVRDAETRARLHGYLEEYEALTARNPFYRFGFIPASMSAPRLLTHMFLHVDILHFFFNMLFLWVVGSVLENAWGSPVFGLVYLLSGVAAALAHGAYAPASIEPAVGASGAVAGLMGAFAIQHARTQVRLAFVYMLALAPRIKFLSVPAWLFLGFWVAQQVFFAFLTMDISVGVAFWAHLGGFLFGALTALLLRVLGLHPSAAS